MLSLCKNSSPNRLIPCRDRRLAAGVRQDGGRIQRGRHSPPQSIHPPPQQSSNGGVTTQLKHKPTRHTINTLSGHIPHHATIPQTQAILMEWGKRWARATFSWASMPTRPLPRQSQQRRDATHRREGEMLSWNVQPSTTSPFPRNSLTLPSYHPYNTLMQPRRLDYVMPEDAHLGTDKSSCARTERPPTTTG